MTASRTPDPPDDRGDDLYHRVAALLLLLPVAAVLPIFIHAICRSILENPKHAEDKYLASNEYLKKICTLEGLRVCLELWRKSNLPGEDAFYLTEMTPGEDLEPSTSTSMGKNAKAASGLPESLAESISEESCVICCRRIVAGLVYFGFAEKHVESKSYRPVYATSKLDPVIMEFISEIEPLFGEAAERLAALRKAIGEREGK